MQKTLEKDDTLVGGEIDGRFSVEHILGQGGMGTVYAGRQLSVGRPVAIKVLRSILANDDVIVQRFFREAKVISQFNHPNIVNLIDFGHDTENNVLYLAMEFIDGVELGDLLKRGRLSPEFVVDLMIQVCEGLSEPHSQGIIHRDLKPENIMIVPRSDGRLQAKVVDFGIAHALQGDDETRLTQTGSVFGTVHYMAPEQACGEPVGPYTDVYALGCILFELLVGATPFKGDTAVRLLMAHTVEPPPVLDQVLPADDLIRALSALNADMLQKNGSQRPATVLEVRDRLEEIRLEHRLTPVRVDTNLPKDELFDPFLAESVQVRRSKESLPDLLNAQTGAQDTLRNTDEELQQPQEDPPPPQERSAVNLATRFNIEQDELEEEELEDKPRSKAPLLFINKSAKDKPADNPALTAVADLGDDQEPNQEDQDPDLAQDDQIEEETSEVQETAGQEAEIASADEEEQLKAAEEEQKTDSSPPDEKEQPAKDIAAKKAPAKPAQPKPTRPASPAPTKEPPPAQQARQQAPPSKPDTPKEEKEERRPTLNIFGLD